jgi:hypothetical protein
LFNYASEIGKIPEVIDKSWHVDRQEAVATMICAAADQENHPGGAN